MTDIAIRRHNRLVAYLVEFPVNGGGMLRVQASEAELEGGLELAAPGPGQVAARAAQSVEHAFDEVRPALEAIARTLRAMAPDEFAVEFGIALSAGYGAVIAKGSADVHFTVTMSWRHPEYEGTRPGNGRGAADQGAAE